MVLLKYFRPAVPTMKKTLTEREVQEANAHVKDRQLSAHLQHVRFHWLVLQLTDSFAHMRHMSVSV